MTTMLKERKAKEGSLSSTSETGPSSGGSGMNVGSIPSTGEDSFDNRSSLLESPSIDQSSQVAPAPEEPGRRGKCSGFEVFYPQESMLECVRPISWIVISWQAGRRHRWEKGYPCSFTANMAATYILLHTHSLH